MFLQSKTQPFKKQPFKKRLGQNTTFWKKVGPKSTPMVGKMLDQNTTFLKVEFGPTFFT